MKDTNVMVQKLGKLKVLVVEDSKVAIKSLTGYLEEMGVEPVVAETGKEALELYQQDHPDIILLDVILPDTSGYELARKIRQLQGKHNWTAIIFLTVMSKDQDLAQGIEAGGDDYLMKPVGRVVLQAKVTAMYRLVRMQRALVNLTGQLNMANQELQRLSMTDGLTGIANRRLFDDLLKREWRRCLRMKKPMALVMLDVDFFKKYNDHYGHQAGDDVLKAVANQISRAAPRATDLVARYGGEEFAMILGNTDEEGARWVANRIKQHIASLRIPHEDSPHYFVSVSCGISSVVPETHAFVDQLLETADKALYQAKAAGRNEIVYLPFQA